jgi:L-amino acid N-acyltransferase YncA
LSDAVIRPATAGDAAACAAIYAPFVRDTWVSFETEVPDEAEVARRIAAISASHAWLVADVGGVVAGYAYGSAHRTRGAYGTSCDVTIYIDPGFGRRGVGRSLYAQLLPVLAQRGFHAAYAGIALPNEGSVALHQATGFEPVGIYREVGWKLGAWRDTSWWQRLL